jgi:transposase InsO family protein
MAAEEKMEVRSAIQQIAVEHRRRYGYRRISAELRRRGMHVNHKRVLRIIREDNLLAVPPRAFVVTTDSDHGFEVYLNLASRMKLTGINQLWVADITYIRLKKEFVYLAVILDAFSRRVVGWALDHFTVISEDTLDRGNCALATAVSFTPTLMFGKNAVANPVYALRNVVTSKTRSYPCAPALCWTRQN